MSDEEIIDPREDDSIDLDELSDGELLEYGLCPNCYADLVHLGGCTECAAKCGYSLCG